MLNRGLVCFAATLLIGLPLRAEGIDDSVQRGERSVAAIEIGMVVRAAPRAPFAGFERLSHGNQQIAMAFYYAQDRDGDPAKIWTLDRIAAKKMAGSAWVEIHARLQREGSLKGVSLGQILSRGIKARQRSEAVAEVRQTARTGLAALAPATRHGAFKTLSVGNRRITEALFDSQTIGPRGNQAWSLDRIANAKSQGASWKGILSRLQADGLIVESGLGPIIAKHRRDQRANPIADEVVVTADRSAR